MAMSMSWEDLAKAREAINFLSTLGLRDGRRLEQGSGTATNATYHQESTGSSAVASASTGERTNSTDISLHLANVPSTSRGQSDSNRDFFSSKCHSVMQNMGRLRSGLGMTSVSGAGFCLGSKRRSKEVKAAFGQSKKKMKTVSWTPTFYCLPFCEQEAIPTTAHEKGLLALAGLGEKKVTFDDIDCSPEVFKDILLQTFPKLKEGGGFELCKCKPNTRSLEPLPMSFMVSPRVLKQSGNSKTYIRPLQRDLNLEECEVPKLMVRLCCMMIP